MYEYAYMVLAFVGEDFLLVYPSFLNPVSVFIELHV